MPGQSRPLSSKLCEAPAVKPALSKLLPSKLLPVSASAFYMLISLIWLGLVGLHARNEQGANWQCLRECFGLCPRGLFGSRWKRWDGLRACECDIRRIFYLGCPTCQLASLQKCVHSCSQQGNSQKRNTNSNPVKAEGT